MRIVIDLQAAQSAGSRNRGIGRYSMSLAKAIVRNRGNHEVLIALSGLFPETIEPIRAAFNSVLPQENIRVWHSVAPVSDLDKSNDWRRQSGEFVREAFLASLKPDIVHVMSVFEGFVDDALTSVGMFCSIPTAVTLYDLIPFIHRNPYLDNPAVEAWYLKKLDHFRRADLWLAISESSRQEGLEYLNLPDDLVVNVSTAADTHFQISPLSHEAEHEIRQKYGLQRPFVMYTGGIDHRKNIEKLIQAFAALPINIRREHQLAIVCSARPEDTQLLLHLAEKQGLLPKDIILTGFVPEDDLVSLYNLCKLFVFPSWHEGFGLPALEAMCCGAPVIGANTSSLPEVIGWDKALFDPRSAEEITTAMQRALCDEAFRAELVQHGKLQSTKFSWDETAKRTLTAFECFHSEREGPPNTMVHPVRRPKLAYVSPLPPERSGIADYSAELLPELARHYEIDVIVAQAEVTDGQVKACWPIRTAEWFVEHADEYDRVLYHFGNSPFHQHMFDLLLEIPGVVVLHDFFLAHLVGHMDDLGVLPNALSKALYHSHGYAAVREHFHTKDAIWKYPCNLGILQSSLGLIVHSESSRRLARQWYGSINDAEWAVIPLMRQSMTVDRKEAREALGFKDDDFVVCSFGVMGPSKLNHRLLKAWLSSRLHSARNCCLIFVGENHPDEYGQEILEQIRLSHAGERVRITGWEDMDAFRQYLAAADLGVQLRTLSRGETSAAVLDCMNAGLATIVNSNGSMADLPEKGVLKLPDEFSDEQLIDALEGLWQDHAQRSKLGNAAKELIREIHSPRRCSDLYGAAIEGFYRTAAHGVHSLIPAIIKTTRAAGEDDLGGLAGAIAQSIPVRFGNRQLLVDVSTLVHGDSKSGIQRVVRSILWEWLRNPPAGFHVEPIYAVADQGYRYARQFALSFLDCPVHLLNDEPLEVMSGDIFIGLDLQHGVVLAQEGFYQKIRNQGVDVKFVVYDLLPIFMPKAFPEGVADLHAAWLKVLAQSDGVIGISRAVAEEFAAWLAANPVQRERPFSIDWFHLGGDVVNSIPSKGLPEDAGRVLESLTTLPTFLSVGTIEPRKGQAQTLSAFELLWEAGREVNLVFVGKQGWKVEAFVEKLRNHPEIGKRLFWLEGVSDEYLEKVYAASTCLIAASEAEGFGLPLIEAAQYKLPIIVRDIPVFREVGGGQAFYFTGSNPEDLAARIQDWLLLHAGNQHPRSDHMPWLTWKQSAAQLLQRLIHTNSSQEIIN